MRGKENSKMQSSAIQFPNSSLQVSDSIVSRNIRGLSGISGTTVEIYSSNADSQIK
jgi:hypothetical protein